MNVSYYNINRFFFYFTTASFIVKYCTVYILNAIVCLDAGKNYGNCMLPILRNISDIENTFLKCIASNGLHSSPIRKVLICIRCDLGVVEL